MKSEEDIRSKIVVPWLKSLGFDENNFSIEFSFLIRLGRSTLKAEQGFLSKNTPCDISNPALTKYYPRADILVRNNEGKNLMVIEVKAPTESLDDEARDQGISYARLLLNGNIAPYVVLTNGKETKVFDSITKEKIDNKKIDLHHQSLSPGYFVSGEDLSLRAEALNTLISLSSENLVAFCLEQSKFRMRPLIGDSFDSSKKYIPSLYIERKEAKERLQKLLDIEKRRVVVLVGPPQAGKTNFVCHMVEQRLKQGLPCLFYPAIGVTKSLLAEIADDFEWIFGQASNSAQFIHKKITSILRRTGQKLLIVIDGWNEANIDLAKTIDYESERLSCDEIQIVVTLTHVAASRLLIGEADNPSFIAEAANISRQVAQLIEIDPIAGRSISQWSVVYIKRYSDSEREEAYIRYSNAYNVVVPMSHRKIHEPYVLGMAMKLFQGGTLPDSLDEPRLLEQIIDGKIRRAIGLKNYNIKFCLTVLGKEMFTHNAPVSEDRVAQMWMAPHASKIPSGFFEAALLSQVTNKFRLPSIDFYYGRERDFVIASWAQNWRLKLQNNLDVSNEFIEAVGTEAGLDALRWFLKQPEHIKLIQHEDGSPPDYSNSMIERVLLSSLCDIVSQHAIYSDSWLKYAINIATSGKEEMARIEAVKLVALLTDDANDLISILANEQSSLKEFITSILSINGEYPFLTESVSSVILDSFRTLHSEFMPDEDDGSLITDVLDGLLISENSTIRSGAATCLGYISPNIFFNALAGYIESGVISCQNNKASDFGEGIKQATSGLEEIYYGSYCPGWLNSLRDDIDSLNDEYERLSSMLGPIIYAFPEQSSMPRLIDLLEDLRPCVDDQEGYNSQGEENTSRQPFIDIYTLPLPFGRTSDG